MNNNYEQKLANSTAVDRVRMITDRYDGGSDSVTVLTSFGVQSGVMLALVAEACPNIRVLFIDTQSPTSQRDLSYGRQVLSHLGLNNFEIAKAKFTREEFAEGMAEVGVHHVDQKDVFHTLSQDVFKITPLKKATTDTKCLLSGVRRGQTKSRDSLPFLRYSGSEDPDKAHPILDWSDEDCLDFLKMKKIPPHPELNSLLDDVLPSSKNKKPRKNSLSSSLRSKRDERGEGQECGIHIVQDEKRVGNVPVPSLPNIVIGKKKCRYCVGAKELLNDSGIEYVEAPVHLFTHLIPADAKTLPVVYLNKKLVGGYDRLCEHLGVDDILNSVSDSDSE